MLTRGKDDRGVRQARIAIDPVKFRAGSGRIEGLRCYGYRVAKWTDAGGEPIRDDRETLGTLVGILNMDFRKKG